MRHWGVMIHRSLYRPLAQIHSDQYFSLPLSLWVLTDRDFIRLSGDPSRRHVIAEPRRVGAMGHQVEPSFPRNGNQICTFLHCRTLNSSSSPSYHHLPIFTPTSRDRDSPVGLINWSMCWTVYPAKMSPRVCCGWGFFCVWWLEMGGFYQLEHLVSFPCACTFFFSLFLLNLFQLSSVVSFSVVYENEECIFTVLWCIFLFFFCRVTHYSHCHWYFKSCCCYN